MQDSWLNAKADEIQRYEDSHDMKNFYSGLKEVYWPTPSGSSALLQCRRANTHHREGNDTQQVGGAFQ